MGKDKQGDKGTAREIRTTRHWCRGGTDGGQLQREQKEALTFFRHELKTLPAQVSSSWQGRLLKVAAASQRGPLRSHVSSNFILCP